MAIRVQSKRLVKLTRALAMEFCEMTMTEVDRPLQGARLRELREEVADGKFTTTPVWASVYCAATKTVYRLNGQHSSNLFAAWDGPVPPGIVILVERFECDTLEEVASLFCRYDRRVSVRTQRDVNRVFAYSENLAPIPAKIIDNAVTGMNFSEYRNPTGLTQEDRAEKLVDNRSFVIWCNRVLNGTCEESRHLMRGPVFAAMYKTWLKDTRAATEFWSLVRSGESASGSPMKKLERLLLTVSLGGGNGSSREKEHKVQSRELAAKCIHAWNAYRSGKKTDLRYYPDADFPEAN